MLKPTLFPFICTRDISDVLPVVTEDLLSDEHHFILSSWFQPFSLPGLTGMEQVCSP